MKNQKTVSIITIFLNEETFLGEAIESVLAQTYQNWELLLVDDGSTDNSSAIAQSYANRYPDRIRYLEHQGHENRGMSASRNLGIQNARGKYISYIDSDDVVQIKICLNCKVLVSDDPLYKYRIHPESFCRIESKAGKSFNLRLIFLDWVNNYLIQHKITDPKVWKALRQAYISYRRPYLHQIKTHFNSFSNQLRNFSIKIGRIILPKPTRYWLWNKWIHFKTLD